MLPFTLSELNDAVEAGDVTKRPHPYLPYDIYNYSPAVQYSNNWNDVTLNCRGLILDHDYNIVARPWKKFFNLGQVDVDIKTTDPVEVMDKADGSLGILYPDLNGYSIATRGSFTSEQAKVATHIWRSKYSDLRPCDDVTLLFEIVYPENRIVLNYGNRFDLILLGAVFNETGFVYGPEAAADSFYSYDENGEAVPQNWHGPVVDVMPFNTIADALNHMERKNAEGYVIRSNNLMLKIKQEDYLELHRLVSNMTPKNIWEQLKAGKTVTEICGDMPDEFHSQVEAIARPLITKHRQRALEILEEFYLRCGEIKRLLGDNATRKHYAEIFNRNKDAKYFFMLLDNRNIHEALWNELKPQQAS